MPSALQKDGFVGPFEISDNDLMSRLIVQLDSADGQFKNFHVRSEICRRLLSSNEIKKQVELNFGKDLVIGRSNSFKKEDSGGEIQWHHDRHFEDGEQAINYGNLHNHFSILLALTQIDEKSGVMEFIPGSHLPKSDYERDTRPFHKRTLTEHFLDVPDQSGLLLYVYTSNWFWQYFKFKLENYVVYAKF